MTATPIHPTAPYQPLSPSVQSNAFSTNQELEESQPGLNKSGCTVEDRAFEDILQRVKQLADQIQKAEEEFVQIRATYRYHRGLHPYNQALLKKTSQAALRQLNVLNGKQAEFIKERDKIAIEFSKLHPVHHHNFKSEDSRIKKYTLEMNRVNANFDFYRFVESTSSRIKDYWPLREHYKDDHKDTDCCVLL